MSKIYYNTHHKARSISSKGTIFNKPSQTIPGEAESIADMFRKFQNGIPIRSRPRSEDDYVTLDHDSPNFELLHPSTDKLTAKVVIPEDPIAKAAKAKENSEKEAEKVRAAAELAEIHESKTIKTKESSENG